MRFLKSLFRKREKPEVAITIVGVGTLKWDEESQYWEGNYKGYKISIPYEKLAQPENNLTQFVTKTFEDPNFIQNKVQEIKALAKNKYPKEKHSEIESFSPQDIAFQNPNFILMQFFGPEDNEPFWFAEIHGSDIYVGFDT